MEMQCAATIATFISGHLRKLYWHRYRVRLLGERANANDDQVPALRCATWDLGELRRLSQSNKSDLFELYPARDFGQDSLTRDRLDHRCLLLRPLVNL
jgi:hypothetical protein